MLVVDMYPRVEERSVAAALKVWNKRESRLNKLVLFIPRTYYSIICALATKCLKYTKLYKVLFNHTWNLKNKYPSIVPVCNVEIADHVIKYQVEGWPGVEATLGAHNRYAKGATLTYTGLKEFMNPELVKQFEEKEGE